MRAKDLLNAYREAATAMIALEKERATNGLISLLPELRVNPHGNVLTTEGGAYVELMMWVPESALEEKSDAKI
jgi:hypothetical protein